MVWDRCFAPSLPVRKYFSPGRGRMVLDRTEQCCGVSLPILAQGESTPLSTTGIPFPPHALRGEVYAQRTPRLHRRSGVMSISRCAHDPSGPSFHLPFAESAKGRNDESWNVLALEMGSANCANPSTGRTATPAL